MACAVISNGPSLSVPRMPSKTSTVDWNCYAAVYDLMAESNPAYREIVAFVTGRVRKEYSEKSGTLLEIGAGTGNHSIAIAENCPELRVIHLDSDEQMLAHAMKKCSDRGLSNIDFMRCDIDSAEIEPASVDGIVMVHSLYTLPSPQSIIAKLQTWLHPDGILIVVDLGKPMRVVDWACNMLWHNIRRIRFVNTILLYWNGREVIRQNRRIRALQDAGVFWTHTLAEFQRKFTGAGFRIEEAFTCYRGYSNAVVCRNSSISLESRTES